MAIYVSNNVVRKENAYANFLMRMCGYLVNEANTRIWEIEYQILRRCNPILMKPNTSGIIKFKSVLQRQEIQRLAGNISQLAKIVNRRKGNRTNTQWLVEYYVSVSGDIFILKLDCYNSFSEDINNDIIMDTMKTNKKVIRLTESDLHTLITEAVKETLNELDHRTYASAADKAKERGEYERMGKFRSAAVNAWNKKFADPINTKTDTLPQRGIRHHYSMEDNDGYNIAMNSQNYKTIKTSSRDYTFDNDGKEYQWDELGNQYEGDGDFGAHESIKYDGMNVARQMARGNGKYVKGKGWQ